MGLHGWSLLRSWGAGNILQPQKRPPNRDSSQSSATTHHVCRTNPQSLQENRAQLPLPLTVCTRRSTFSTLIWPLIPLFYSHSCPYGFRREVEARGNALMNSNISLREYHSQLFKVHGKVLPEKVALAGTKKSL